jgi:hypothetical protein
MVLLWYYNGNIMVLSSEEKRRKSGRRALSKGNFKRRDAETLSYLSLRLCAFALIHFERKNYFLRENLAVLDILCIFASD